MYKPGNVHGGGGPNISGACALLFPLLLLLLLLLVNILLQSQTGRHFLSFLGDYVDVFVYRWSNVSSVSLSLSLFLCQYLIWFCSYLVKPRDIAAQNVFVYRWGYVSGNSNGERKEVEWRISPIIINEYALTYVPWSLQPIYFLSILGLYNGYLLDISPPMFCCATNRKAAVSIPAGVNGFFFDIKSFRSHHGPGVDSAS